MTDRTENKSEVDNVPEAMQPEPPVVEPSAIHPAGRFRAQDPPRLDNPQVVHEPAQARATQSFVPVETLEPTENQLTSAIGEFGQTEVALSDGETPELATTQSPAKLRWYQWPIWLLGRSWDLACLCILLAVVSAVPVVQLASLGYLLGAAANLAQRRPWSASLPGLRIAGKLGTFVLLATLMWLPVWFVTDLSYSAQLLRPSSPTSNGWRIGAFVITGAWIVHVSWAAMRGGRWWHLLWPAPLKFVRQFWRPATWNNASQSLYDFVGSLRFPSLWWLGARASAGALLWITIPISLMIIGLRADDFAAAGFVGFIGAVSMIVVMLYLPFLQIQLATDNRFASIFKLRTVRKRFLFAPWAHTVSLLLLCLLCIPLYLLRIEATPAELVWAPSLVFVLFMLPAKLLLGAAIGYAEGRQRQGRPVRHWTLRWPARAIALASVLIYVGALYVAQLVAYHGALVMYFQHAFLVPAPLVS